jgi:hypothetical protein
VEALQSVLGSRGECEVSLKVKYSVQLQVDVNVAVRSLKDLVKKTTSEGDPFVSELAKFLIGKGTVTKLKWNISV